MPNLLTCLSEPGIAPSCCEAPYQPVMSDCVLDCLVREQQRVTRTLRTTYGGMLEFGTKGYGTYENQLQDMQLLTTLLYDLFLDRVASVAGGNDDWVVADVWEEHDLGCVADYFRCRYKLDIRPWLLHAGLYDPAHPPTSSVMAQLPIPYEVPCGTNLPVPPDPDPPLEEDCIIPTFMVVSGAVDSAYETSADPLSTYLIVSNLLAGSGGWNDQVSNIAAPGNFITPPDPSNVAVQGSDQIWVVAAGGAKALFPIVSGVITGQSLDLTITAIITPGMTLLLQVSDGSTFETVYNGDPASLGSQYTVDMSGATVLRAIYTFNGCTYGPFDTSLIDTCAGPDMTFTPEAICGTSTWQIVSDIVALNGFAGGTIEAFVNGVGQGSAAIGIGTTTYGPYDPDDVIYFELTHPSDPVCNITTINYEDATAPPDPSLYLPPLFTQNTVTLVYMATIPVIAPAIASSNPNIRLVYDCGSGDVEFYNGPINSFVPIPITPQPSCDSGSITGAIIYEDDCDIRIDAEIDTYTPPGEIDPEFSTAGVDQIVRCAAVTRDTPVSGKFYIGGDFNFYDPDGIPVVANGLTRLNLDGTLDTVFNDVANDLGAATPGFDNRVDTIKVDSQNRVIVCGYFTTYNDQPARGICRILEDGTIDSVFMANIDTGFNTLPVTDIELDPATDDIYAIGNFTSLDGVACSRITRIIGTGPTAGTIDATYVIGAGFTGGNPYRCAIAPNGNLIVNGGQACYDRYKGTLVYSAAPLSPTMVTRKTLVSIKSNGDLSATLALGNQFEEIAPSISNELAVQADGYIICVGSFVLYNSISVGRIAKLKGDGSLDGAFNPGGPGFDGQALSVVVMPGGQILVGSAIGVQYNGVPQFCLSRLLSDGTLDPSFSIGPSGFDGTVYCAIVDSLGGTIVGGQFVNMNGTKVNRIARMP